ncbi:MAG: DJ-1/PfpI family protein [Gammaproteobacteria bacterium]|nr:MAG: DJ-1/PfpI family protein [Gammaproteobacteria bacterium]
MSEPSPSVSKKRTIGALLFPDFELLDIFGPLEMLGVLPDYFEIVTLAERSDPVASAQGPQTVIDRTFANPGGLDVLLVPGGRGTRREADNPAMLDFLRSTYPKLEYLASICTGSGLLAAAGLLDGKRATSNKKAFDWPQSQSDKVTWVPEARWVEDGNIFTASGVAAGIDMSLALIATLLNDKIASRVAEHTEYDWHRDNSWDPYAALAGLG